MQPDYVHHDALAGIRQVPDSPTTPNGHRKKAERPFTMFDDVLLDEIMPTLSAAAWKVLSYILRRTIGYENQPWAEISYSQFRAGRRRDGGAGKGVSSDTTIKKALAELEGRGLIEVRRLDRQDGDARMPTAFYRAVLPPSTPENGAGETPSTPENGVGGGGSAPENGVEQLHNMEQSTPENGAVNSRKWGCSTPFSGESKRDVKKRPKETDKETPKETLSPRAGARAREHESGPLHPSEGTKSSRGVEAVQTCFSEHLVHGERIAPSALPLSEGGNVTPAPPAGPPADKTKVKSGSISLELVEGESVDLAAAKLFLSTVPPGPKGSGWKTAQAHVLEKWRKLLAPLLDDLGPTDYGRWVRYMVGEPWLAEDPQRINWVKEPWLGAAVTTWQNLPPEQQDVPLTVAKADRTERVRERELEKYKDPRKVGSRASDKDPVRSCLDCASKPGQPHLQGCMIVMKCDPTATVVTMEHCDTHWATPLLAAWNKLHPPEPTYAEDGTPTCCQCAVKVGYKHQFSCAYIRHAGLPMESLVTAEQNDPAHYKAVYAAQKAEQERQIQIERDKARKEQGRD